MAGNYGFDPYSQQAEEIARKQRYAELLRQQSMQPVRNMGRGRMDSHLSWTQGLAKAMQGYNAGAERREAAEQSKALREQQQGDVTADLEMLKAASVDRPAEPLSEENLDPVGARKAGDLTGTNFRSPGGQAYAFNQAASSMKQRALVEAVKKAMPGGSGAGGAGGITPEMLQLALTPGGSGIAGMIQKGQLAGADRTSRETIAGNRILQAQFEFNNLSAAKRADLAQKGITNAIDYAKYLDSDAPPIPGMSQALQQGAPGAPQAQGGGQPMPYPVESPQERQQAAANSLGVLNGEQARGEIVDPAAAAREQARLTPMAGNAPVPTFQSGAPPVAQPVAAPAPPMNAPQRAVKALEDQKAVELKAKRTADQPAARRAIDVAKLTINKMKTSAQELKTAPGIERIFGKTGMFPSIPGGDAANAQAKLNVLKNQVFASALQALRDASKTGGAVGQVSNVEGVRFENMFAALEQAQSIEQFQTELDKIIAHVDSVNTLLEKEYAGQYGQRDGDKAGGGAGGDDPLGLRR